MAKRKRRTDNTMAKRKRRTDNTMVKRKRRTDNTMAKRNTIKRPTTIHKKLHRKLTIHTLFLNVHISVTIS
jgi:hypothetical protein